MNSASEAPRDGHEWAEVADTLRSDGDFTSAADHYALAGYAHMAERPPSGYCKHISWALHRVLVAGVCDQIADRPNRCRNRCRQGVLIAEDTLDRVRDTSRSNHAYDQARIGAWYEYIGDLRLVGDIDHPHSAYEQATAVYREAGDPSSGFAEQEHMRLHDFFQNVALPRGHDEEEWNEVEAHASLTEWVEYKREHLPGYLSELYRQNEWNY